MHESMITTRREFLHRGSTLLAVGATVPTFLQQTMMAMADPRDAALTTSKPGRPDDHVLVVVQLAGGNDGLNTIVPFRSDDYYRARPRIAVERKDVLALTDEVGLHPEAVGLKAMFDQGELCVVQQVGYPNPNRSHFKSMDIWHTASPDGRRHEGWLGRYFDNTCSGEATPDPQLGVALMTEAPLAMRGQRFMPVAFDRADELNLRPIGRYDARETIESLNQVTEHADAEAATSELDFLTRTAMNAQVSADAIRKAARTKDGNEFPRNPLGDSLETVSRMIAAGLPTRVYYVSLGGFDTHAQQKGRHATLMRQFGGSLKAFVDALKKTGHYDRTCVLVFSEFGRRVQENASGGTDHGEAAPMFLTGGGVKPGVAGPNPDLSNLHRGDLPHAIDFRTVYAAVLRDWFRADTSKILGRSIRPLKIMNTQ